MCSSEIWCAPLLKRVVPFTFQPMLGSLQARRDFAVETTEGMGMSFFRLMHGVHDASQVQDGLSQVMRNMAKLFMLEVPNFSAGILLQNLPRVLGAKLGIIISDADALKQMFSNKGASGSKPCIRCRNVVC